MRRFFHNSRAIVLAVGVHLVVLAALALSFNREVTPAGDRTPAVEKKEIVQARVVDDAQVQIEIRKLEAADAARHKKESDQAKRLEKLLQQAGQAEDRRKREEQRLTKLKKAQAKKKQETRVLEKKRKAEQQRLADLKKKRATEKRKQTAAEKRRKTAELQKKKAQRELQKQLAADQQRRQAESALSRFIPIIEQHVRRHWNQPPNSAHLRSRLRVRLTPGGEVLNVAVLSSSGDAAYDRSVESAVHRASPLPLPSDPAVAELLRKEAIVFNFDPSQQG